MTETTPEATETTPAATESTYTPPPDQAALDRIVADRVKRVKAQFGDYGELKSKAAKLDEITAQAQSETERAVAAAREEEATRVRSELLSDRVLDRVEVLAAKEFADPEDARLHLAGRAAEFIGPDGKVDGDVIKQELAALLAAKPHLAAGGDGKVRGVINQGVRGEPVAASPGQTFASFIQQQMR